MVQARDAVEQRSWSHPQEPVTEEWWADVLADPRARIRKLRRSDVVAERTFYRLADEPRDTILVACGKCEWKAAWRRRVVPRPTHARHPARPGRQLLASLGFRTPAQAPNTRPTPCADLGSDIGDPAVICFKWPGGSGRARCRWGESCLARARRAQQVVVGFVRSERRQKHALTRSARRPPIWNSSSNPAGENSPRRGSSRPQPPTCCASSRPHPANWLPCLRRCWKTLLAFARPTSAFYSVLKLTCFIQQQ